MGSADGAKKAREKVLMDKFGGDIEAYKKWQREIATRGGLKTAERWKKLKELEDKEQGEGEDNGSS